MFVTPAVEWVTDYGEAEGSAYRMRLSLINWPEGGKRSLYTDEQNRAWIFRTCGYGHDDKWWKEFISTLRMFGYDYVLSIERASGPAVPSGRSRRSIRKSAPAGSWAANVSIIFAPS